MDGLHLRKGQIGHSEAYNTCAQQDRGMGFIGTQGQAIGRGLLLLDA